MYDLIIIGGGPGGVAAGVYADRKKLKTLLVTDEFGGQSKVSDEVQNWIGVKSISGFDLSKALEEHLRAQKEIEINDNDLVSGVAKIDGGFDVSTQKGKKYQAKTVLIVSGSHHKKLGVTGEDKFNGRGVAYCSTCDAPLFAGKEVAVAGGGNSALEAVVDLLPYATKVYLLVRSDKLKGDPVTQDKIKNSGKAQIMFNSEVQEVSGDQFVSGVKYLDKASNSVKELPVGGVFVEVGSAPNSDFIKGMVDLNEYGYIVTDPKNQRTSTPGIWAAGDVTDLPFRQNNISAGDSVKALLDLYNYLNGR
ncbi:MAG: FAD-dependent oxidoreductase [Patescibacteria group bacterium]|nr:FAD-dependent oxidoreductase [Patescibacteria group bacterium]MDE2144434.1 FAD-dependent oxidoreductase [Patescibacteria group bacterium]